MNWLRQNTGAAFAVVTRAYSGTGGTERLIQLPQNYWDYVDWAEARGDMSFADWVLHCEAHPQEGTDLSALLMYWLWQDECSRWMGDRPTPTDAPPKGLLFWKATYGRRIWTAGYVGWGTRPQTLT